MFKRYLDFLSNSFIEHHQTSLKVDDWLYEATDRITVWLVTLSTGSVALLISSSENLALEKRTIIVTISLFICSIVTGILGRVTYLIASRFFKDLTSTFSFNMKIAQLQYFPRELNESTPAANIYFYIKEDFGFDLESYTGINSFDEFIKEYSDKRAQDLYKAIHNYCCIEKDRALKEINRIINHTFNRPPDYVPPAPRAVSQGKADFTLILFRILTGVSIASFLAAVLYISFSFIK